jgi:hypothetical protein
MPKDFVIKTLLFLITTVAVAGQIAALMTLVEVGIQTKPNMSRGLRCGNESREGEMSKTRTKTDKFASSTPGSKRKIFASKESTDRDGEGVLVSINGKPDGVPVVVIRMKALSAYRFAQQVTEICNTIEQEKL